MQGGMLRGGGLLAALCIAGAAVAAPPATPPRTISLAQTRAADVALPAWPFVTAVPLPEKALADARQVRLYDEAGEPVPAQFEPLAYWTAECASIQWLRVAFLAPVEAGRAPAYSLQYGVAPDPAAIPVRRLQVAEDDDEVVVDTGAIRFVVPKREGGFLTSVRRGGDRVYSPADGDGPYVVDQTGGLFRARLDDQPAVVVEEANAVRAVVRAESWCLRDRKSGARGDSIAGARLTKCILRYHAYAGEPWIELHWTFVVTADTEVTAFRDIGLRLSGNGRGVLGLTEGQTQEAEAEAYVIQKKARVYKFYEKKAPAWVEVPGLKAPPPQWMETSRGRWAPGWAANASFSVAMRDFAALFPKELHARSERGWDGRLRSTLTLHAWPAHGEFNDDWFAEPASAPAVETPVAKIAGVNGAPLDALYFQNSQRWHHGPILDFGYPDWWRGENVAGGPKTPGPFDAFTGGRERSWEAEALCARAAAPGPVKFHALGASRTQEVLLDFSESKPDDARSHAAARRKLFADSPHVWLKDPAWLTETRVLAPLDAAALRRADAAAREARRRAEDTEHAGMWTWGSLPERQLPDGSAGLARLYGGDGLAPAGVTEWILYMRTGDPLHLRHARAATAQWRDVLLVHFTAPAFTDLPPDSRKLLGAATAPSAYPWRQGGGGLSRGDILAWDYCLRGDLRSLEALKLHAQFLLTATLDKPEGARAAQVRTLREWHAFTWESQVAARLRELGAAPTPR
jgi:hypothetical protein